MKSLLIALTVAIALVAQTPPPPPGTIVVAATITATAGTLSCIGGTSIAASTSVMHFKCADGSVVVLPDIDFTVTAPASTLYSITRGVNSVTLLLTKGNAVPDQWQIAANGVLKTGGF